MTYPGLPYWGRVGGKGGMPGCRWEGERVSSLSWDGTDGRTEGAAASGALEGPHADRSVEGVSGMRLKRAECHKQTV